jgi:cytoskeletal protein CcmA (bactofilin family)
MRKTDASSVLPLSVVAAGTTLEGDSETLGSFHIDGTIRGNVRAGKSVVISKDGLVCGSIYTSDAVIAGTVLGAIYAESHLELQATSRISGEIQARQMHMEDGAALQGQLALGGSNVKAAQNPSVLHEVEEIPWRQLLTRDHDSFGVRRRPVSDEVEL